ncbi:hypothetical protein POM88_015107 [Heracleum sosnowskyi]|uniref:Pyruvate kinase n=1 Tax=Heracleum sosnowskyi TaxID=360622 RepID=A0AAD8MVV3_9APIA|nr:hypothetical protein POM88_015107 [Heracleum sosnowskyi]
MTGSDAILLRAETLRGLYPVETISIVGKICAEVEILSILRESEDSDLENGIVGLSQKEMEEETESFYPEFTPASFFHGLVKSGRKQLPKLVVGLLLAGSAVAFYATRNERVNQILQQTEITSTSIDEVSENPRRRIHYRQSWKKTPFTGFGIRLGIRLSNNRAVLLPKDL